MRLVHISDTHGVSFQEKLVIPECDVLIHSGDYSPYRSDLADLAKFLIWFEAQPAKIKIFIAGNHDLILDRKWVNSREGTIERMLAKQKYMDAKDLIQNYRVVYLNDTDYVYQGIKFWGSPYSPTFGNDWAFNSDRGKLISKIWAKIPSDVDILITHTPVYGFLDVISERQLKEGETDLHRGCKDLLEVIQKRLIKLKLHCSGHIHDNVGVVLGHVSNKRRVLFSNGGVISNEAEQLVINPLTITI